MASDVRPVPVQRVQEPYCVRLAHAIGDLTWGEPGDGRGLAGGALGPARRLAAEDQGDDAAGHVLVDAGEFVDLDMNAGLLQDLAGYAGPGGLVEFEDAAGEFPGAVVGSADRQESPVLAHHYSGNGDGVQGRGGRFL